MKFRVPEIVVGMLLATAFYAVATLFLGQPTTSLMRSVDEQLASYTLWLTVFTFLLFAATLGLTWIAFRQERHFVVTERPYLYVAVQGLQIFDAPLKVTAVVKIRNHGKTPAVLKRMRALLDVSENYPVLLSPNAIADEIPPGLVVSGSGGEFQLPVERNMSGQEVADVKAWHLKLLCLGEITYVDNFGTEHRTGFCWEAQKGRGGARFTIAPSRQLNFTT